MVAAADGRFSRGQVPLRDAGADLDVVVFASPMATSAAASRGIHTRRSGGDTAQRRAFDIRVVPLCDPACGQLWQVGVCRA